MVRVGYFDFELADSSLLTLNGSAIICNQGLPVLYERDFVTFIGSQVYEESNIKSTVLVMKKVAFFLVTVALGKEPESYSELRKTVNVKFQTFKQSKTVDAASVRIIEVCKMIVDSISNCTPMPSFSQIITNLNPPAQKLKDMLRKLPTTLNEETSEKLSTQRKNESSSKKTNVKNDSPAAPKISARE